MSIAQELLPNVDSWTPMQLRLVAFPTNPQAALQHDWWRALTGNHPETAIRKTTERNDSGAWEGRSFTILVDPLRITLSVDPYVDVQAGQLPSAPPLLGHLTAECEWFSQLVTRWLEAHCPETRRLAYFARLFQRTETRDDSYRLLSRYLDGVRVDLNGTDFMYRLNRRRPTRTGIQCLDLNRLCTWYSAKLGMSAQAQTPGDPRSIQTLAWGEIHGCVLEADINTAAEFNRDIPHDAIVPLFREMVAIANDVASRGDV